MSEYYEEEPEVTVRFIIDIDTNDLGDPVKAAWEALTELWAQGSIGRSDYTAEIVAGYEHTGYGHED